MMINMIDKISNLSTNLDKQQNIAECECSCKLFCEELVCRIQECNSDNLIQFLNLTKSKMMVTKFPYEILSAVISILNRTECKKIFYNATKTLTFLAIHCNPSELIVYLIEQMEHAKTCQNFYCLLSALEISLLRSPKLFNVIDMVIDVIKSFITYLPTLNADENSEINENTVECIVMFYINVSNFINNLFIQRILPCISTVQTKVKHLLLEFLVSIFNQPICFMNIDQANLDLIFNNILRNLYVLKYDIIHFYSFFNHTTLITYNKFYWLNSATTNPYSSIDTLAVCNFLWIGLHKIKIIQVYDPYYIMFNCINAANYLISHKKCTNILLYKSFDMINYSFNIIQNNSIPFNALDLPIHKDLIYNLSNIMLYNDCIQIRKNSFNLFTQYINIFETKAKFVIINKLINSKENSKIISIVIGILKNIIDKILIKNQENSQDTQYLMNGSLDLLILKIYFFRKKTNTKELLEISDEIITKLNFIIFLIIKSKKSHFNFLENCLKEIENKFLPSIENVLPLEKNKWISKLEDLKEKEKHEEVICDTEYPFITFDQKVYSCNQAINSLLLIENILFRIHELLSE